MITNENDLAFEEGDYFRRVWWNPIIGGGGSSRWWVVEDIRQTGPYGEIEVGMEREDSRRYTDSFYVRLNRKGMPRGFHHHAKPKE